MLTLQELINKSGRHGSYGGWITARDLNWLVSFLQEIPPPDLSVEIGVYAGSCSNVFLLCSNTKLHVCIDDWSADSWTDGPLTPDNRFSDGSKPKPLRDQFIENVTKTGFLQEGRVEMVDGQSQEIGLTWNRPIDLLYIDGDHHYEPACKDIDLFAKWVKPGGHCLIDDYDMESVRRAISDRFLPMNCWDVIRGPVAGADGRYGAETPDHHKLFAARRRPTTDLDLR